jgi:hypothetical protein
MGTSPTLHDAVYRAPCEPAPQHHDPRALVEVTATWDDDVLTVAHLSDGDRFTLSSRGASWPGAARLVLPACEARDHALVRVRGGAATVHPPGAPSFELTEPVVLRVDRVTFEVRRVPRADALPPPRRERFFAASFALSLAVTAALAVAPKPVPPPWADRDARGHDWIVTHIVPRASAAYAPVHADTAGADEGGTGRRAAGDEGRAGRAQSVPQSRRWVLRPSTPQRAVPTSIADRVQTRGVFAALGAIESAPTRFMPDATERVPDTGNMYGDAIGAAHGDNALGLLGTGFGGGGGGQRLIGLGAFSTRGHGDHTDVGQGLGGRGWGCGCMDMPARGSGIGRAAFGRLSLAVRTSQPVVCRLAQHADVRDPPCLAADVTGGIDAATVRRVVRANLGQVRHCYERALEVNPSAEGTISLRWVIGADGQVVAANVEESSVPVASLGECVTAAVRRWRFPMPDDTVAVVRYPFSLAREEP